MKKHEHSGGGRTHFVNHKEILESAGIALGETFLDLGCGRGDFSIAASELVWPEGRIYALDSSEESISKLKQNIAKKKITSINAIAADAVKTIPLPAESIDACLMSNVLHGFVANEEFDTVMDNIQKVMKEKGRLIIIEFKTGFSPFGPPQNLRLSIKDIETLFNLLHYAAVKKFKVGLFHYGVVLQK